MQILISDFSVNEQQNPFVSVYLHFLAVLNFAALQLPVCTGLMMFVVFEISSCSCAFTFPSCRAKTLLPFTSEAAALFSPSVIVLSED